MHRRPEEGSVAATRYTNISFDEAMVQKPAGHGRHRVRAVPRPAAKLPIKVFSIFKHGALKRVVMANEDTLVYA